ncbi:MAG: acyl-CoA dehydrogenase [Streptosporangiales bacterium]|nr:acyl-CoA dehydrogenase [Streptosporangiales bacterium]
MSGRQAGRCAGPQRGHARRGRAIRCPGHPCGGTVLGVFDSQTLGPGFELSSEHLLIQRTVREFIEAEMAPVVGDYLEHDAFPEAVVRGLADIGVMGLPFPEEYGGSGAGMVAFALALEEIARVSPSVAAIVFAHSSPATLIFLNGTEEQKREWLVQLAEGRIVGAIGLTEPSGGSDAGAVRTKASWDGTSWILNGSKTFITNAGTPMSGVAVVAATTELESGSGLSSFIIPADAPGFETGEPLHKIGWRAADTREIFLRDCRLSPTSLLGKPGEGLRQMLTAVTYGRVCVAAIASGLARACFEQGRGYARERVAFGRPIADNQGVAFKLVDVAVGLAAARLLTYRAAALVDGGQPFRAEASMAKLHATETAFEAARQAIQIHGAYGISREQPVSWLLGEAKVLEIVEGTSEIQRMLLARLLGISE